MIILFAASVYLQVKAQSCYELVWSDEFSYSGLPDSTKWSYDVGGNGWGNNELQYYTDSRLENARVEDGKLIIEARKEIYSGKAYTSARIITYPNGHFWKYGKIEARMKLPYGKGIWPAFWMLGTNLFEGTSWPACGEIDIMEMVGGDAAGDKTVYGTVHWDANGYAKYGGSTQLSSGIFADTFHVFSIEWNETHIRWYLDGNQYHVIDITPSALSEFQQEFYILLNLAVGGNWPGNPDGTTVFPQKLEVDYVRVYQLNTQPQIIGDSLALAGSEALKFSVIESDSFTYNWNIPAEAFIVSGQGTHEIVVNWGCDSGTVVCELSTQCQNYELTRKVNIDALTIRGNDFVAENETNLLFSIPQTAGSSHTWILPEGVTLISAPDSNAILVNWNDADGEIKVVVNNLCGNDSTTKQVQLIRQLPYPMADQPHSIPGTIESVHYDIGGEGLAYHDNDVQNQGNGSRPDEGVDTERNDGSEVVGWILTGEWLEYTVQVEASGTYDVEIRTASINSSGLFTLSFNERNVSGNISVPSTGAWNVFNSIVFRDLQLFETDTLLRVDFVAGGFNLGKLVFVDPIPTNLSETISEETLYIYPTNANNAIYFGNLSSEHNYNISDVTGRIVKVGVIQPGNAIDISGIKPGIYYVAMDDSANKSPWLKFIKVQ